MDIPRYWRLRDQRYLLQGSKCLNEKCNSLSFPPRIICPKCKSREFEKYIFKGKGTLYSYTTIYQPPDRFVDIAPYHVGIIDLEEGIRVTAQITDVKKDDIYIGMPVEMVVRQIYKDGDKGPILYGYKFRPVLK